MSGGGKGGKTTTEVKIPAWLEEAAMRNIGRAETVAGLGYAPYYGPDVAAMTPFQLASGQGINAAASAFGLPTVDVNMGMPEAQTFDGGLRAYSSGGLYDQAVRELETRRPGQYDAITGLFVDPITGAPPLTFGQPVTTVAPVAPVSPTSPVAPVAPTAPSDGDRGRDAGDRPSTSAPSSGGFTSIRDMIDGGGPGRSGTTFSGGPLSGVLNMVGVDPLGSRAATATPSKSTPSKSTTAASTAAAKEKDRAAESAANRAAASKSQREAGEGKGGKSGPSSSGSKSSGGKSSGGSNATRR